MSFNFIKNVLVKIVRLKRDNFEARFIKHNGGAFESVAEKQDGCPVVLMELSSMQSAHIAYSYLANVLSKESNARIIGYVPRVFSSRWKRLAFNIAKQFGLYYLGVYRSFGTTDFLAIEISGTQRQKAHRIYDEIISQMGDKWAIEALTIHGICVGDLIYDTYLARFKKPTIDISNQDFQDFLRESVELFVFWEDYLDNHDVRAINVSHCVYNIAMPLRLGVERNIPVFQANVTHVYRMSKKNYFAYNDFFYFRERFAALPEDVRVAGIEEAKRRIERRFAGR